MAATAPVLELESLYVKIFADASQFTDSSQGILNQITGLNLGFAALGVAIAGFVGGGVTAFKNFDDALTRSMAHMRDWQQASRPLFEKAVFDISARSISTPTDMAKALGVLGQAGFNAAGAAHALAISENLAVAGGLNVEQAATKQVNILRSLDLLSGNVNKDYAEMTRLSNLLVGVAPQAHTTVEKLADALGGRFTIEMRNANVSLEDGIALLAVLSERQIEGTNANQIATRFMQQMQKTTVEEAVAWKSLGVEVYDAQGKLLPIVSILKDLDKLGTSNLRAREGELLRAGVQPRTMTAFLAVMGSHEEFERIKADMGGLDGIMQKQADMIRGDFASQLQIFWNNVVNASVAVGSRLAPAIAAATQWLAALIDQFRFLNPAIQSFIVWVGMAAWGVLVGGLVLRLFLWPALMMVGNTLLWLGGILFTLLFPFRMIYTAVISLASAFIAAAFWAADLAVFLYGWVIGAVYGLAVAVYTAAGPALLWLALSPIRLLYESLLGLAAFMRGLVYVLTLPWIMARAAVTSLQFALLDLQFAFRAVGSSLTMLWSVFASTFAAVNAFFIALPGMIMNLIFLIGNWAFTFQAMFQPLALWLISTFTGLVSSLQTMLTSLAMGLVSFIAQIPMLLANLGAFVGTLTVTFALWLVAIGAALYVVGVIVAFVGAAVATVALTAWEVFEFMGQGLLRVWQEVKEGLAHIGDGIAATRDIVVNLWESARAATQAYFDDAVKFGGKLVGFFWHFQENMIALWEWLRANWQVAANDIGSFIGNAIQNIALNVQMLTLFIMDLGRSAWETVWNMAVIYASHAFSFIRDQWQNLMDDMGEIFKRFGEALAKNFAAIHEFISTLATNAASGFADKVGIAWQRAILYGTFHGPGNSMYELMTKKEFEKQDAALVALAGQHDADRIGPSIKAMMDKLVGPDFSGIQFKTDFGHPEHTAVGARGHVVTPATGIYKEFEDANSEAVKSLTNMGVSTVNRFKTFFSSLHGVTENFTPEAPWTKLMDSFKLDIPENAGDKFEAFLKKMMSMLTGDEESQVGPVFGKEGPGFEFKQISLQRTMLGGVAAETIDYQQLVTLKAIDNHMVDMIDAARGIKVPPQMPVTK